MNFADFLKLMVHKRASDLFITAGVPPSIKVDGKIQPLTKQSLTPEESRAFAYGIMTEEQRGMFEASNEANFSIHPKEIGRFRINVFMQQGRTGMVVRTIQTRIPTFEELRLPGVLTDIAMTKRGMVLFAGATGSGKSTSLAALIGYRNKHSYGHVVTIEDPIEFVHEHNNCIITQREVGVDTDSFDIALRNAMRQAPDVILIGEIRTRETMDSAIVFSETGHLCLATLHANNTYQALDRVINFFPEDRRDQLLMDLSLNLRAIVSQRLIPVRDGKGRVPAVEVLINSPLVSDLIQEGRMDEVRDVIARSRDTGMMTFDQCLFDLYEQDLISYEDALRNADSVNDVRLRIKLDSKNARNEELGESMRNVTF
ncbi:MAG: PilT/PilU family type 4a pilus ATPase [Gammaproteobacteria bacterium]|jgi:twitching motility protein PilU|nr:PilT/PilU family type 4a pilus ATPase [Gammaproteobacteria bacterium]